MTEREQFIEDWRAIISGLPPKRTPEEVEAILSELLEMYDTERLRKQSKTE